MASFSGGATWGAIGGAIGDAMWGWGTADDVLRRTRRTAVETTYAMEMFGLWFVRLHATVGQASVGSRGGSGSGSSGCGMGSGGGSGMSPSFCCCVFLWAFSSPVAAL